MLIKYDQQVNPCSCRSSLHKSKISAINSINTTFWLLFNILYNHEAISSVLAFNFGCFFFLESEDYQCLTSIENNAVEVPIDFNELSEVPLPIDSDDTELTEQEKMSQSMHTSYNMF